MLHVLLHGIVGETTADETFGVEHGVGRVHGDLVLGCVADETLSVSEGNVGRRSSVALVVGDDLDLAVLEDADAGVRRAQVDADCWCHVCWSISMSDLNEH